MTVKKLDLQITAQGGIAMLHDDEFDISEFGTPSISRASHVEPYTRPGGKILWRVFSAGTGVLLWEGFETREAAIEWEKKYYSPDGPGWKELTE